MTDQASEPLPSPLDLPEPSKSWSSLSASVAALEACLECPGNVPAQPSMPERMILCYHESILVEMHLIWCCVVGLGKGLPQAFHENDGTSCWMSDMAKPGSRGLAATANSSIPDSQYTPQPKCSTCKIYRGVNAWAAGTFCVPLTDGRLKAFEVSESVKNMDGIHIMHY